MVWSQARKVAVDRKQGYGLLTLRGCVYGDGKVL